MGRYLIVGRAGSGKSTVTRALLRRNYTAFDADSVEGLSSWFDRLSHEPVKFEDNSYVDLDKFAWLWRPEIVNKLLQDNQEMFLCGGAENDLSFQSVFDTTFILKTDPEIQLDRIRQRSDNEYGKDPRMSDRIIQDSAKHLQIAQELGVITIDANQPVDAVVAQILAMI